MFKIKITLNFLQERGTTPLFQMLFRIFNNISRPNREMCLSMRGEILLGLGKTNLREKIAFFSSTCVNGIERYSKLLN